MAYNQAQNKATQKHLAATCDQLRVWVRKDSPQSLAAVKAAAADAGESLAAYVIGAIAQKMGAPAEIPLLPRDSLQAAETAAAAAGEDVMTFLQRAIDTQTALDRERLVESR